MKRLDESKAVVLLSGGQDSVTSLFWAIEMWGRENIKALSINYGQKHVIELECGEKIARMARVGRDIITVSALKQLSAVFGSMSSLLNQESVNTPHHHDSSLPSSFIPGRNIIFLTIAAQYAYLAGAKNIVTGVCQTDYSGYPDCREEFILSIGDTLRRGMDCDVKISTPILDLSKKDTVLLAAGLPGCMKALAYSHTCYNGQFPPCGVCPACVIRHKGFSEAGIEDPIFTRAKE